MTTGVLLCVWAHASGQAQTGAISGKVTNSATGASLIGITVNVFNGNVALAARGHTDSVGSYAVRSLPPGSYYVTTQNQSRYIDELYNGLVCMAGFACNVTTGTPVSVVGSTTTSGVDFALEVGARLSGTVTAGSTPLFDVFAQVWSHTGDFLASTRTDSSGRYLSYALPSDTYFVMTYLSSARCGPA